MTSNEGVNSVVHAIRILDQFQSGEGLSVSEISKRIGIPRATTYRLLNTFILHQILLKGEDKKYRLTLRLMELGQAALSIPTLQQIVDPFLAELTDITGETGHFSILDGYHVGYIAKKESSSPFRMLSYIGWRGPLHATASGKILLAYSNSDYIEKVLTQKLPAFTTKTITDPVRLKREIEKVRKEKYAVDDEELSEGLLCISVPVELGKNQMAAISISGPKQRILQNNALEDILNILHEKSKCISDKLMSGKDYGKCKM